MSRMTCLDVTFRPTDIGFLLNRDESSATQREENEEADGCVHCDFDPQGFLQKQPETTIDELFSAEAKRLYDTRSPASHSSLHEQIAGQDSDSTSCITKKEAEWLETYCYACSVVERSTLLDPGIWQCRRSTNYDIKLAQRALKLIDTRLNEGSNIRDTEDIKLRFSRLLFESDCMKIQEAYMKLQSSYAPIPRLSQSSFDQIQGKASLLEMYGPRSIDNGRLDPLGELMYPMLMEGKLAKLAGGGMVTFDPETLSKCSFKLAGIIPLWEEAFRHASTLLATDSQDLKDIRTILTAHRDALDRLNTNHNRDVQGLPSLDRDELDKRCWDDLSYLCQ